jgi:hypothetical protein
MSEEFVGFPGEFSTPPPDAEASAAARSPLEQVEEAKRQRDLVGELGALTSGYEALTSAPWYPAQAGDMVHVNYSAVHGETYVVEHSEEKGGLVLVLRAVFADVSPLETLEAGAWAPGIVDDPFMELWMEAGPDTLAIVRNGRDVHGGAR